MSLKLRDIIKKIEYNFSPSLCEDYDNSGLIIGGNSDIENVLVCLDITEDVICEAVNKGANLIISHHPLIFKGIKRISTNSGIDKIIKTAIKKDINIYALHTNFDTAWGGLNDIIASKIDLKNIRPLTHERSENLLKFSVYVPLGYENEVRDSILSSGAGYIGNYSHCSFSLKGEGTFMPLSNTNPFIGKEGNLEKVSEIKIETIVKEKDLLKVLNSMLKVHPYEEPAYDIYPLKNNIDNGIGRIGDLKDSISLNELCNLIKDRLKIPYLNAAGDLEGTVKRVAIVTGSGSEFIYDAKKEMCDVLLTGDVKHHSALDAQSIGLSIIDAGHYYTEVIFVEFMVNYIINNFKLKCFGTEINTNPFKRV